MKSRRSGRDPGKPALGDPGGVMKGKAFVVDWDLGAVDEHAGHLFEDGWEVMTESVDSRRAFDLIKREKPDVVVVYLSHMAAYGRALAADLKRRDETREIPVLFVDGQEKEVAKALQEVPDSIATRQEDVLGEVLRFRTPRTNTGAG